MSRTPTGFARHQAAKLGLVDGCGTMHTTMRQQYGDKVLSVLKLKTIHVLFWSMYRCLPLFEHVSHNARSRSLQV